MTTRFLAFSAALPVTGREEAANPAPAAPVAAMNFKKLLREGSSGRAFSTPSSWEPVIPTPCYVCFLIDESPPSGRMHLVVRPPYLGEAPSRVGVYTQPGIKAETCRPRHGIPA